MSDPVVVRTLDELTAVRARLGTVALVPTMGALHEGHLSLIALARGYGAVVVSVFVNPLQFGPTEDLDAYPRTFDADLRACAELGVDVVFAPTAQVMYPRTPEVTVNPGRMGTVLEGAHRPGHLDGVLTVVMKLLHMVRPQVAVFGRKDGQQLALVRRMVADLDLPVRIVAGDTVREPDGLALSSRNSYLDETERRQAASLSRALFAGRAHAAEGPRAVVAAARRVLDAEPGVAVDYLALVDPNTFADVGDAAGEAMLAVAARVGATRLIDNVVIQLGSTENG